MYNFSTRSETKLRGVHPDLVKVVRRALELTDVDFGITCGVRSPADQEELVAKGASLTDNSRHIPRNNENGYSCAVDVAAYVGHSITWDPKFYKRIARAFIRAAIEKGVQIEFGGLWTSITDWPHIQLSWKDYP